MKEYLERVKPNFLIVGAAKAGSSSLYCWLKQHPQVFMPDLKEPCYFVRGYGLSDWDEYLSLFEPGRGKSAIGEASAAYLGEPESPKWIKDTLGDLKIIILLRNPVQRALSLYGWMVMEGYEWLNTFEEALTEEVRRVQDKYFRWNNPEYFGDYLYFRNGLYYEQVKTYMEVFGRALVKVYLFDDLVNSPGQLYRDACNFLEISNGVIPDFIPQNPSKIPRFISLQFILRRLRSSSQRSPRILQPFVRELILLMMNLNIRLGYKASIRIELKKNMQEKYRENVAQLSELIGRDLAAWLG